LKNEVNPAVPCGNRIRNSGR